MGIEILFIDGNYWGNRDGEQEKNRGEAVVGLWGCGFDGAVVGDSLLLWQWVDGAGAVSLSVGPSDYHVDLQWFEFNGRVFEVEAELSRRFIHFIPGTFFCNGVESGDFGFLFRGSLAACGIVNKYFLGVQGVEGVGEQNSFILNHGIIS